MACVTRAGAAPEGVVPDTVGRALFQAVLRRYARIEAAAVAPVVCGHRVLDLGAGEGYVARALQGQGLDQAWTCAVDVGPFRRAPVPYVAYDGRRLPFADATFDTTLILLTLHHCASPEAVLDEAVRVTRRRLIVTESVFRNRRDRFWLDLLDDRLNRLRHGGEMNVAYDFRRLEDWRRCFESRGLRTVETRWLGAWWERLVHHPVLFVLDKKCDAGADRYLPNEISLPGDSRAVRSAAGVGGTFPDPR